MTGIDTSAERLTRIRRILGSTRAGRVQFIVNAEVGFVEGLQSAASSGGIFGAAQPARPVRGKFSGNANRIDLNPAYSDAELVQTLAQKSLEGNVHRYKSSFPLLGMVEKLPGMKTLWDKIINTLVDAAMDELAERQEPGFTSLPRLRNGDNSAIVQEIIDVVEHGIEGITARDCQKDPAFRARVEAVMGSGDTTPKADRCSEVPSTAV